MMDLLHKYRRPLRIAALVATVGTLIIAAFWLAYPKGDFEPPITFLTILTTLLDITVFAEAFGGSSKVQLRLGQVHLEKDVEGLVLGVPKKSGALFVEVPFSLQCPVSVTDIAVRVQLPSHFCLDLPVIEYEVEGKMIRFEVKESQERNGVTEYTFLIPSLRGGEPGYTALPVRIRSPIGSRLRHDLRRGKNAVAAKTSRGPKQQRPDR